MATPQFIQKAYIAFFNRPADKAGFDFWQGTDLPDQALLDQFAQSPEYLSDYAGKSNKQIIEMVYKNLFGREPEQEGWDYWAKQMDDGWVTVGNAAYEILGGAQGTDKTIIDNKTAAAQSFTSALNNAANADAYAKAGDNGVGNLAKEWLSEVDAGSTQFNPAAVLSALVNANSGVQVHAIDFGDNNLFKSTSATLTLSTDGSVSDVIKLSGPGYGTSRELNVANFDADNDYLDFSFYGAKWVGAVPKGFGGGEVAGDTNEQLSRAAFDNWIAESPFPRASLSQGDKYITLTPSSSSSSTEYKIDLWTVKGSYADARHLPDVSTPALRDDPKDIALTVGYIDLDCLIDGTFVADIVL